MSDKLINMVFYIAISSVIFAIGYTVYVEVKIGQIKACIKLKKQGVIIKDAEGCYDYLIKQSNNSKM